MAGGGGIQRRADDQAFQPIKNPAYTRSRFQDLRQGFQVAGAEPAEAVVTRAGPPNIFVTGVGALLHLPPIEIEGRRRRSGGNAAVAAADRNGREDVVAQVRRFVARSAGQKADRSFRGGLRTRRLRRGRFVVQPNNLIQGPKLIALRRGPTGRFRFQRGNRAGGIGFLLAPHAGVPSFCVAIWRGHQIGGRAGAYEQHGAG